MKIFTRMKHMMLLVAMCCASTAFAIDVTTSHAYTEADVPDATNGLTLSLDGITVKHGPASTKTDKEYTWSYQSNASVAGYTGYVSSSDNPRNDAGTGAGATVIPVGGAFVSYAPVYDGTIAAAVVANNGKSNFVLEVDGEGNIAVIPVTASTTPTLNDDGSFLFAEKYYGVLTFDVKAGYTYYLFTAGSKMSFYGFSYTYEGYGAELVHTASSFCKATIGVYECTVDAELEYINNSKFGNNAWQGAAYAEFEIAIPEGKTIKSAVLNWTASSGKSYPTTVYYVNPGLTLDYAAMSTTGSAINLEGTSFASVTFKNGVADFVTDASDAVKAIADAGQNYIIFKFTGNQGSGNLYGMKAAVEKRPKLTIEFADANSMTTYTVKYVDESGDEIKEASVYDILAGETASVADENKAAIYKDDKKYIYVSCDKESITTVTDGASNIIIATFREAVTCNYTANAVDGEGNVLKTLVAGSNFEGETVTLPYNQYIFKGGVLYEAGATNKEYNKYITLSSDNMTSDVTYSVSSKTNVVYFCEAEDVEGMSVATGGNANVRCSNAAGACNTSDTPIELLTLTPGTYTISTQVWGSKDVELTITCGDESLVVTTTGSIASGSKEFAVTENAKVTIPQAGSGGNSPKILDWILIQSAGANSLLVAEEGKDLDVEGDYASATYTRTIAADAYGTICLPFAPDAASLENYTFFTMESAEDGVINFVEKAAPVANTPYIYCLKEGKTATVITGGATVVSTTINDVTVNEGAWSMVGSFANQSIDATTGKFYGLSSGKIVRATKTLNVKPYRAYFTSTTDASAVALRITRGDETTEISAADLDVQPATVIYDLAGRRVEKMEKGIYIVNGKKVIK